MERRRRIYHEALRSSVSALRNHRLIQALKRRLWKVYSWYIYVLKSRLDLMIWSEGFSRRLNIE